MYKITSVFKWNFNQLFKAILGIFIFCFALNIFIIPMGLYNGGILGLAQLMRTLIVDNLGVSIEFDIAGLLNFMINVPLFILAYKNISKTFFARTLFCVTIQTIFLTFIPTLDVPIVNDMLTSVLIGGILAGVGAGMALSSGASTGGTDIICEIVSKYTKVSLGRAMWVSDGLVVLSGLFVSSWEIVLYGFLVLYLISFMIDKVVLGISQSKAFYIVTDKLLYKYELNKSDELI